MECASQSIQFACLEIIRFRQDLDSQKLFPFLSRVQDPLLLHHLHLTLFVLQEQHDAGFLLNNLELLDCPLFEETLNEILYRNPSHGIILCQSKGKTLPFSEEVPEHIGSALRALVQAGKIQDRPLYLSACQSLHGNTVRVGFEVLGYLGMSHEIPFLIDSLKKEDWDDQTKQTIAEALERITGAGITETIIDQPYDEEDIQTASPDLVPIYLEANEVAAEEIIRPSVHAEDWEDWWKQTQKEGHRTPFLGDLRYRYGKLLSFPLLIQIMENWELPAKERQQAWGELRFVSGHSFPFQALAPLEKQIEQIQTWKDWQQEREKR